jgi:hypothetical protein
MRGLSRMLRLLGVRRAETPVSIIDRDLAKEQERRVQREQDHADIVNQALEEREDERIEELRARLAQIQRKADELGGRCC